MAARSRAPTPGVRRRGDKWQGEVFDHTTHRKIRRTFETFEEARAWRDETSTQVRKGQTRAPSSLTLRDAADQLVAGMRSKAIMSRKGEPYKPSVVSEYGRDLDTICEILGGESKLSEITRARVRRLVEGLQGDGLSGSRIRGIVAPLRVVMNRALEDGVIAVNVLVGMTLPKPGGPRDRVADPEELGQLLAALPLDLRVAFGLAGYGGLRFGEIIALRRQDVNLATGTISVTRAYDPKAGEYVDPKSEAGTRTVPIVGPLRDILAEYIAAGNVPDVPTRLLLGNGRTPLDNATIHRAAAKAWAGTGLRPIGLHECRHSAASAWINGGRPVTEVSKYLGHSDTAITIRTYAHAFERHDEFVSSMDAVYAGADEASRAERVAQ